jgi:hypothetical protein
VLPYERNFPLVVAHASAYVTSLRTTAPVAQALLGKTSKKLLFFSLLPSFGTKFAGYTLDSLVDDFLHPVDCRGVVLAFIHAECGTALTLKGVK